jgi:hypothetical protein
MPPMHRDPRQHRASPRHRSHDDQNAAHKRAGRESAMREETMIADRQAEACEKPHAEKQADLDSANAVVKQQTQRDERAGKRQHIEDNEVAPLQLVKVAAPDDPMIAHVELLSILASEDITREPPAATRGIGDAQVPKYAARRCEL